MENKLMIYQIQVLVKLFILSNRKAIIVFIKKCNSSSAKRDVNV